jgi:hypothetical protein
MLDDGTRTLAIYGFKDDQIYAVDPKTKGSYIGGPTGLSPKFVSDTDV